MPTIGDLIAKWANGRNALLRGEVEELRLKLNRIEAAASRLDTLSAPMGGLDPNIFGNRGGFSVLPHEGASMYFDTQAIATSATNPVRPVVLTTAAATWSRGFYVDNATSRIYVTGLGGEAVLLFVAWWGHAYAGSLAAAARRELAWAVNATPLDGALSDRRAEYPYSGYVTTNYFVHVRKQAATDSFYEIGILQNSGGNLNGSGLFTCCRIR